MCANLLESFGALDKLVGFVSTHGRRFYGLEVDGLREVKLRRTTGDKVVRYAFGDEAGQTKGEVVTFWEGKELGWVVERD